MSTIQEIIKDKNPEQLEINAKNNTQNNELGEILTKIRDRIKSGDTNAQEREAAKKFIDATKMDLGNLQDETHIFQEIKKQLRYIKRDVNFNNIKENGTGKEKTILKEAKNLDEIKNPSDILFLKKEGLDLAKMFLINKKDLKSEVDQRYLQKNDEFIVNFGENRRNVLNKSIGATDILPMEVVEIAINGIKGIRKNRPRPGYYTEKGKYLPIFDGDRINIVNKVDVLDYDMKKVSEKAEEIRFKKMRISDIIEKSEGKTLDDLQQSKDLLPEDRKLLIEVKEEQIKRNKWKEGLGKIKGKDVSDILKFRINEQDFKDISDIIGLDEGDIPKIKAIMSAIGKQESGSNYLAVGKVLPSGSHKGDSAIGRYQVMPKNWTSWSNKYFGQLLEINPENQDKIAFAEIGSYFIEYKRQGLSLEDAILEVSKDWYGRGQTQISNHPTTPEYAKSIMKIHEEILA